MDHSSASSRHDIHREGVPAGDPAATLPQIGRYLVQQCIGAGAFGRVLAAFDPVLERHVAIKVVSPHVPEGVRAELYERFCQETRLLGRLSHPHVVGVYDAGLTDGLPYMVMELCSGPGLERVLQHRTRLSAAEVAWMAAQTASALDYVHSQGIVHRDLKPANLLLHHRSVKLTDFGIALSDRASRLTMAGQVMGTPAFMSPEQAQGGTLDHRSDLFSLGMVLFTLLAGRPPFLGEPLVVMTQLISQVAPPISSLAPDLSTSLDPFFAKALAMRPADRFASGRELCAAMMTALPEEAARALGVNRGECRTTSDGAQAVTRAPKDATASAPRAEPRGADHPQAPILPAGSARPASPSALLCPEDEPPRLKELLEVPECTTGQIQASTPSFHGLTPPHGTRVSAVVSAKEQLRDDRKGTSSQEPPPPGPAPARTPQDSVAMIQASTVPRDADKPPWETPLEPSERKGMAAPVPLVKATMPDVRGTLEAYMELTRCATRRSWPGKRTVGLVPGRIPVAARPASEGRRWALPAATALAALFAVGVLLYGQEGSEALAEAAPPAQQVAPLETAPTAAPARPLETGKASKARGNRVAKAPPASRSGQDGTSAGNPTGKNRFPADSSPTTTAGDASSQPARTDTVAARSPEHTTPRPSSPDGGSSLASAGGGASMPGVAVASTVPPVLRAVPPQRAQAGDFTRLVAELNPPRDGYSVYCRWRQTNGPWTTALVHNEGAGKFSAELVAQAGEVEYRFELVDDLGNGLGRTRGTFAVAPSAVAGRLLDE